MANWLKTPVILALCTLWAHCSHVDAAHDEEEPPTQESGNQGSMGVTGSPDQPPASPAPAGFPMAAPVSAHTGSSVATPNAPHPQNGQGTTPGSTLIVLAAGYQSCGTDSLGQSDSPFGSRLYQSWNGMALPSVGPQMQPTVLALCYGMNSEVRFGFAHAAHGIQAVPQEAATELLSRYAQGANRIVIIGHSYGGWLAMHMARALSLSRLHTAILVTVDPISPTQCSLTNFSGCKASPTDPSPGERLRMRPYIGRWLNAFQQQSAWLSSGPVAEADQNIQLYSDHRASVSDTSLWQQIVQLLAAMP